MKLGTIDAEGKQYMSNIEFFADAFNYLLYDGQTVIKAQDLQEVDTTELAIPYGNHARIPVQKYRDIMKLWNAYKDKNAIYVLLGAELQDQVHYGMPVKNGLYDMLGYSRQIAEIKRSNKRIETKQPEREGEAELAIEDGVLRLKLTSAEFLSGLRKGDKLIPIITAVIYFGEDPWDGPKSLYDLLDIKDETLRRFIPNYWINLISPVDMEEAEFRKFHTELGDAMRIIKHQKEDADEIILSTNHKKFSPETAYFLNRVAKLDLDLIEEAGGVDMCASMEKRMQKQEVIGSIKAYRLDGASDEDIITKVMKIYNVTREYVLSLLTLQQG